MKLPSQTARRRFAWFATVWMLCIPALQVVHARSMMDAGCGAPMMQHPMPGGQHSAPSHQSTTCCDTLYAGCSAIVVPAPALATPTIVHAPVAVITSTGLRVVSRPVHVLPFSQGPPVPSV